MKYLGIDYSGAQISVGIYNSKTDKFELKKYNEVKKIQSILSFIVYPKFKNKLVFLLLKYYSRITLMNILKKYNDFDYVVLSSYSGVIPYISNKNYLIDNFEKKLKPILNTDHFWGHINAAKYNPQIKYPALVVDSSAQHTIVAYIKDKKSITILKEYHTKKENTYSSIGRIIIESWIDELEENIYWPGQKTKGKENVYELYKKRGKNGKVVESMKEEIEGYTEILATDDIIDKFIVKMREKKRDYISIEDYKNDWVASQHEMLRNIFDKIKSEYTKTHKINSFIVSGGISNNPAFDCQTNSNFLKVPSFISTDQDAGWFLAYLGYCVNEEGLQIKHDRWKKHVSYC